ncbi:MAG: hypothetical protein ABWY00_00275 [Dongiaceae bacterium]
MLVTMKATDIGTVVAFAAGLAKINDPWGDLVTWYRDFRIASSFYRLLSAALPPASPETAALLDAGEATPAGK